MFRFSTCPFSKSWNGLYGYGIRYVSDEGSCTPCFYDGQLIKDCKMKRVGKKKKPIDDDKCPKIAIIGAGMAGMSAASALQKSGVENYTIYESSNRIGGRVHSAWCGEGLNELGAEWLEGEWNPVLRLASIEGLTPCQEDSGSGIYMREDGIPLSLIAIDEAKTTMDSIMEEAVKEFFEKRESDFYDISLLDFIKKKEQQIDWKDPMAKELFGTFVGGMSCKYGAPPDVLSLNDASFRFYSDVRQRIREGLIAVFEPMMSDVPSDRLKLKHRVQTIKWDGCPIKLIFEDCSEETADMVIVTLSLGVLKKDVELFEPELPENKLEAIRNTGYDVVNKIFLDYAEPFWLRGDGRVFVSRSMDHDASDWESSIFEVREICGGRNTLQISLCGPTAATIENIPEEDIAKTVTPLLRKFTGVAITPYPIGLTKTKWLSDPNFMGSMSYMGKHSNRKHLLVLAEPLPTLQAVPKLLFAGDATSGGHIGTVEGARKSGFREAYRIIDIVQNLGWPPKPRHNLDQFLCTKKESKESQK